MSVLSNYEPKEVFKYFEELSAIPRASYDDQRASDYFVEFAKSLGLKYRQDDALNVIIWKDGTAGYENSEPVILQGHMDMVADTEPGVNHDWSKDGIDLFVEDGLIGGRGTTLGGDDAMATCMIQALLASTDIPHPPLECIITSDEEPGMIGAAALDVSDLKATKYINIDSEIEGIFIVGCCGGFEDEMSIKSVKEEVSGVKLSLSIKDYLGGHSGLEINKQRGNANKDLGRLLFKLSENIKFNLVSIEGGTAANVITKNCEAVIIVNEKDVKYVSDTTEELFAILKNEYDKDEPAFTLSCENLGNVTEKALDKSSTEKVVTLLEAVPNGVQTYERSIEGLPETSLNIGLVRTKEDAITIRALVRTSIESKKEAMKEKLVACSKMVGATSSYSGEYPAWQIKSGSKLVEIFSKEYEKLEGKKPEVSAVHAGLEAGLMLGKNPNFDCISFGPNVTDAHSYHERLEIASMERSWKLLKAVLADLK
ncbi:MAG: aminoacyl-histidine dipeptidase [Lachnospiraceae bacterium]|nr:aminoacyl-histidine dipeptidase [Lachnospiraceae bacterium]